MNIKISMIAILALFMWVNVSANNMGGETSSSISSVTDIKFKGYAYSQNEKTLLYSEHHHVKVNEQGDAQTAKVSYFSNTGELMAEKYLEYHDTGYLPDFEYKNLLTKQGFKVNDHETYVAVINKQGDSEFQERVSKKEQSPMIVDAGFDVFMRANWTELLAGNKKDVAFLSPTRAMFIAFEIELIEPDDNVHDSIETVRFQLRPQNFIIALLVDPIDLNYHKKTGRIMSYKGLTNIETIADPDKNYVADIEYVYEF